MPTFGRYETIRELHRTGLTLLWTARAAGGSDGFVVKEVQARAEILGEEASGRAVAIFLERARVQQRASAEDAAHWAPVLETGETESGAFLVTRLYPRSAQRLIAGRAKLDSGALASIVDAVLRGLAEVRRACGRGHGNLKPSNVLIDGSADEPIARAVLSDPGEAPGPGDEAADLRALGELIYQLVMHQPFRARAGWPVPSSPEWSRLGAPGSAWLELCNRLLDPSLADNPPALGDLAAQLSAMRPAPRSRRPALLIGIAAGALALAGVAGTIVVLRSGGPKLSEADFPFDAERWAALCRDHNEWIEGVRRSLDPSTPAGAQARARFADDAYLREVLKLLDDYSARLTPQAITRSGAHAEQMMHSPPDAAREPVGVKLTAESGAVVDQVRARLSSGTLAAWDAYTRLGEAADECDRRGWTGAAAYLRSLTDAIQPRFDAAQSVSRVLDAAPLVEKIRALAGDIDRIAREEDAVLSQIGLLAAHDLGAARDLKQITAAIESLQDLATRLGAFIAGDWQKLVDRELLATRPVYGQTTAPPDATRFNTWLTEAQDARNRKPTDPDPRDARWAETIADIRRGIGELTGTHNVRPEEGPAAFASRADTVEGQVRDLAGAKWNSANQVEITRGAEMVRAGLDALRFDVQGALDAHIALKNQSVADFRRRLQEESDIAPAESASINATWRRERDVVLESESEIERIHASSKRLRDFLTELDRSVPRMALSAGRPWESELRKADDRRRDEAIASILAAVGWDRGAPPASFEAPPEPLLALDRWRAEVGAIASDVALIEDRLNSIYGPADRPEPDAPSAAELAAACRQREALNQADVAAAVAPVLSRYAAVEALAGDEARDRLLAAAADTRAPAGAFAAWRRLGEVAWPPLEQSLRDEVRLQGILQGMIGAAPPSRREALRAELLAGGRARWAKHVSLAASAPEIRSALALRGDLNGEETDLDARALYNLFVYELELAQADAALDEAALIGRVEAFVARARELGLADGPPAELLGALGELTSAAPEPRIDVTTLGPAGAGWMGEASPDGSTVRFTKGNQSIDFVRVNPSQSPPAFVSATEASFQLFQAALADSGQAAAASAALYQYTSIQGDPRQGPRVWRRGTGDRISVDPNWLAGNARVWPRSGQGAARVDPYPPGINAGAPSAGSPMQYVSPVAAAMAARALNCRLPSGAEWTAALEAELQGRSLEDYIQAVRPNLRDQAWNRQLEYLTGLAIAPEDAALVRPAIDPSAGSLWGNTDRRSEAYDDGALWFVAVDQGPGSVFKNLVGNVAEMVFDDPASFDAIPPGSTAQAIDAVLRRPGLLHAAGYSALSPREPQPLRPLSAVNNQGSSDVGFRLAFSAEGAGAPAPPLAVRLGQVLEVPRFIPPAGSGQ